MDVVCGRAAPRAPLSPARRDATARAEPSGPAPAVVIFSALSRAQVSLCAFHDTFDIRLDSRLTHFLKNERNFQRNCLLARRSSCRLAASRRATTRSNARRSRLETSFLKSSTPPPAREFLTRVWRRDLRLAQLATLFHLEVPESPKRAPPATRKVSSDSQSQPIDSSKSTRKGPWLFRTLSMVQSPTKVSPTLKNQKSPKMENRDAARRA